MIYTINQDGKSSVRIAPMQEIEKYIDLCLIDEYACKDFCNGYTLDIDDIPDFEKNNFIHLLMKHDTAVRDIVLDHMQILINSRLPDREYLDRSYRGVS